MANVKRTAELSRSESGDNRSASPAHSRSETGMSSVAVSMLTTAQVMPQFSDSSPGSKSSSPTDSSKSQIDFQFLNFSHPSDAKGSRARRTVRSHVTKQQHQKEHAAAAARRAKSYPQPDSPPEAEDLPAPRRHAATFPSARPTLELPERPAQSASGEEVSSPSPSPTGSSPRTGDQQIDPREVYPADWHPYLPKIMVCRQHLLPVGCVDES